MRKYNVKKDERWNTAVHEAGHAFMQHSLCNDFSIAEVLPVAVNNAIGLSRYNGSMNYSFKSICLEPLIHYAGAEAVNVLIGLGTPTGCGTDYKRADRKINNLVDVLSEGKHDPDVISQIKAHYKSACYKILEANKDLLNDIAEVLFNDGAITQLEVVKLFNKYTVTIDENILSSLEPKFDEDFIHFAGIKIYRKMPVRGFDFDKYNIKKALAIIYAVRYLVTELLYPGTWCKFEIFEPYDSNRLIFESAIPYPLIVEHDKWNKCTFRKRTDISYLAIDLAGEMGMKLLYPEFESDSFFGADRINLSKNLSDFYLEIGIVKAERYIIFSPAKEDRAFICNCLLEMLKENKDLLNAMVNDIYNEETDTLEYEWFGFTFDDLEEEYPLNRTASKLYQNLMTLYINNPASFAQIRDSFMQACKTA
ncbi:MAG: hypothetical protein PUB87_06385 [Eubacteriaceae bacterium]|nr:hypothetical protein [Eubacteriaceae bacterium]